MSEVAAAALAPVQARARLEGMRWGTRVEVRCSYPKPGSTDYQPGGYVLVLRTADGATRRVATWNAVPGRTARITAATALRPGEIAILEIRTAQGHPLLRLRNR